MSNSNYPNRNRKKKVNLSGLYAVSSDIALENGKPRDGVHGFVKKGMPYICKVSVNNRTAPHVMGDMTGIEVPTSLKNRMVAFYSDSNNSSKSTCYLVEKPLYDEMLRKQGKTVPESKNKKVNKPKKSDSEFSF